jgi:hypothetical protein
VCLQPLLEQWVHLPGQAQHDGKGAAGPGLGRGFEDALDLGVVDEGNHGRDAHPDRDTRLGQALYRLQPPLGHGRARLEDAGQAAVERGDGHVGCSHALGGHGCDQVDVTLDA